MLSVLESFMQSSEAQVLEIRVSSQRGAVLAPQRHKVRARITLGRHRGKSC